MMTCLIWITGCGATTGVDAPCDADTDCDGTLICDVHEGEGSCQAPHEH